MDKVFNKKVKCGICYGSGQRGEWEETGTENIFAVLDCPNCGGTGYVKYKLLDDRKKNKGKLVLPTTG